MKICFILEHFFPHVGGVETVFYEYSRRLAERGYSVQVVTSNSGGITGLEKLAENLSVEYLPCASFFGHPLLPYRKVCESTQSADIVHTTTYTAAIPSFYACRKTRKHCILTVHEVLGKDWFLVEKNLLKAAIFFLFERFVITRSFDAWHAVSRSTMKSLEKAIGPSENITTIYNGVDAPSPNTVRQKADVISYFGFGERDKVFLYSGRPGKTKGIPMLIEAVRNIHPQLDPSFKFGLMLSDDPMSEKRKFMSMILKYGLTERIRVGNPVPHDDLSWYRKSAYAILVPSLTEGFGFNAAESCALDVPVIVSDAGALPEVVSGRHLVFRKNDAGDLAAKLLLATEGKFKSIPPKIFSWNDSTDKMEILYETLSQKPL